MTEILTESFCERCGTRYTFETARPRHSRIGRAKTFTKGLRNYVLSDDSLSESMADARGEEEQQATVHQLDAFHKTFNFCFDCRQYTCGNCWNNEEGRCLSCAPRADTTLSELEPSTSAAIAGRLAAIVAPPAEPASDADAIGISAWPASDLPPAPLELEEGPLDGMAEAEVRSEPEAASPADEAPVVEAIAAPSEPTVEPAFETLEGAHGEAIVEDLPEPRAAALDAQLVIAPAAEPKTEPAVEDIVASEPLVDTERHAPQGLKPGESVEDAIAAYEAAHLVDEALDQRASEPEVEAVQVEAATEPEVEAVARVVTEALPEAVAEAAPEPVAEPEAEAAQVETAAEPEAEAVARVVTEALPEAVAEAAPEPVAEPEAEAAQVETAAESEAAVVEPAANPESEPASMAAGWLTVAPDDGTAPAWPERPSWPTNRPPMSGTLAGRKLMPSDNAADLWAASAREVIHGGPLGEARAGAGPAPTATAQPCIGCGLSLSANARFCRRCGTRQG